ncbi:MAG TPA: hypothetical protein VIL46_09725, partial [Gemmataceae bacterium]
ALPQGQAGQEGAPPPAKAAAAEKGQPKAHGAAAPTPDRSAVIAGRVLGPDGAPRKGAKVWWRPHRGAEKAAALPETTADADGRFRLRLPPGQSPANGVVVASADGAAPDWAVPGAGGDAGMTLRLAKDDLPITGRVLDLEGRPVEGATVRATSVEAVAGGGELDPFIEHWKKYAGMRHIPVEALRLPVEMKDASVENLGLTGTATTDRDGRFRLSGFGRDRVVYLEITAPGLERMGGRVVTRENADLGRHAFAPGFEVTVGPGKSITGVVRDRKSGKPVAGMRISCGGGMAHTDGQGRYRIDGLRKQERYFVATGGGGHFYSMREVADTPGLETVTYDLGVDQGIDLRGRLTDAETGQPIPGSVWYLAAADNPHVKDYPDFSAQSTIPSSGAARGDGQFRLPVIPGRGWLLVTAKDEDRYASAATENGKHSFLEAVPHAYHTSRFHAVVPVDIDPVEAGPVTVDVALRPGRRLAGKLVGPDGEPVSGVFPAGLRSISVTDGVFNPCEALKGAEFTILGLSPGRERPLVFYHLERNLGKLVRVPGDQKGELTVKLEPLGGVTGRLLDAADKPIAGAYVRAEITRLIKAYDDLPWELMHGHMEKLKVVQTTGPDGRFQLDGLVPGLKYFLTAGDSESDRDPPFYLHRGDLTVEPGAAKDLGDLQSSRK